MHAEAGQIAPDGGRLGRLARAQVGATRVIPDRRDDRRQMM
jgi:hypothetical protein